MYDSRNFLFVGKTSPMQRPADARPSIGSRLNRTKQSVAPLVLYWLNNYTKRSCEYKYWRMHAMRSCLVTGDLNISLQLPIKQNSAKRISPSVSNAMKQQATTKRYQTPFLEALKKSSILAWGRHSESPPARKYVCRTSYAAAKQCMSRKP